MRIMDKRIVNRFDTSINTGKSTLTDSYEDVIDVFKRLDITQGELTIPFEFDSDKQIDELIDQLKELKDEDW